MSEPHDFQHSLARSHAYADAPWWAVVYKQAFPSLRACVDVRADGWAQRAGIDRMITLACGRTVSVDEKVREKVWPDILLERWSNEKKRDPGWVQKALDCEFIAYAFVPTQTCFLFPTLTLQRAWRLHGRTWCREYPEIRAQNKGYVTLSVAVPIDVVFAALHDAMKVCWTSSNMSPTRKMESLDGLPLFDRNSVSAQ
jgi:hypothetical protein